MLLEPLVSTIETLKQRISTHGAALRQNETRTRTALIDPLFRALGWDVSDPSLVTPEYRVDVGWADYALLGLGNKPVAVIEAKRLGSVVENHLDQAVGYCIQQGIAYAGVTDGSHWQLYRTFEPVPLVEKLVLDVSIAETPAHDAALKLLLLWCTNLASGQPVAANAPVLVGFTSEPLPLPDGYRSASPVPQPQQQSPNMDGNWIPLNKINPADVKVYGNPKAIKFSNGNPRNVRNLREVLTEATNFLVESRELTTDACPIPGINFVNSSPKSPAGRPFRDHRETSGGLFVNVSWNRSNLIKYSIRLLSHFGVNPETVELRFD